VLRASAMAVVAVFASFLGRPISRARVVAFAVIVLLLADPFLLHSVAFLLSCGASAGIAFVAPALARRLPGPRLLADPLAVSLGAQLGVLPVLWWAFGSFPLVTPIANVLVAPAASVIGTYGFVASAIGGVAPAIGAIAQQPTAVMLAWVTAVARAGAAVSPQLDGRALLGIATVATAVASVACAHARRLRPVAASR
jgi:competence protein ComEC